MKFDLASAAPAKSAALKTGWNLIGCPLDGSTDIAKALASIWPNVVSVKNDVSFYDTSAGALSTLLKVEYGKGYFVKVDADCVLTWVAQ